MRNVNRVALFTVLIGVAFLAGAYGVGGDRLLAGCAVGGFVLMLIVLVEVAGLVRDLTVTITAYQELAKGLYQVLETQTEALLTVAKGKGGSDDG